MNTQINYYGVWTAIFCMCKKIVKRIPTGGLNQIKVNWFGIAYEELVISNQHFGIKE